MHGVIQRFVGRYEVWRDQRAHNNPLNLFAIIVGISLLQVAYDVFVKRHFTWRVAPATVPDVAFLVLFFRRSRWAWIALPFWGAVFLIAVPFQVAWATHYPWRVAVFVRCLGLAMGAGLILWGFAIRRRYYSYIDYER
jgi:hypothetical protein